MVPDASIWRHEEVSRAKLAERAASLDHSARHLERCVVANVVTVWAPQIGTRSIWERVRPLIW